MQALQRVRDNISEYLAGRLGLGAFLLAVLLLGVISGALAVGALGGPDRAELMSLLGDYLRTLSFAAPPEAAMLGRALLSHGWTLLLVWLLGLSVVGAPGILAITFARGFSLGFAAAFLAAAQGWKGILLSLAAMLPQNLLAWPALLLAGSLGLSFGWQLIQARRQHRPIAYYSELGNLSIAMLVPALGFAAAAALEAFLCPVLMALVMRLH